MATLQIPLRNDLPHFDLVQVLDAVSYLLTFHFNTRDSAWYLSLALDDETPIWSGVKVVVSWPLQARSKNPLRPPGMLVALDASNLQQDPGLNDLGQRVQLFYFDAATVAGFKTALGA